LVSGDSLIAVLDAEKDSQRAFLYVPGLHTGTVSESVYLDLKQLEDLARIGVISVKPWRAVAAPLARAYSELTDALTWKQYQAWSRATAPSDYRTGFEHALKFSKSAKVRAIVARGLALCAFAERVQLEVNNTEYATGA
jgi:hypothetical protein